MKLPYSWDSKSNRWRDIRTGRYVTSLLIRHAYESIIQTVEKEVVSMTNDLRTGRMSLADWQRKMAGELVPLHVASAMSASGALPFDTARIAELEHMLQVQMQRMDLFATQVQTGAQRRDGTLVSRARMYVQAGRMTYETMIRNERMRAGDTLERCILHGSHHCQDCIDRADRGWVKIGTLPMIGAVACYTWDQCTFEYSGATQAAAEQASAVTGAEAAAKEVIPGQRWRTTDGELVTILKIYPNGTVKAENLGGTILTMRPRDLAHLDGATPPPVIASVAKRIGLPPPPVQTQPSGPVTGVADQMAAVTTPATIKDKYGNKLTVGDTVTYVDPDTWAYESVEIIKVVDSRKEPVHIRYVDKHGRLDKYVSPRYLVKLGVDVFGPIDDLTEGSDWRHEHRDEMRRKRELLRDLAQQIRAKTGAQSIGELNTATDKISALTKELDALDREAKASIPGAVAPISEFKFKFWGPGGARKEIKAKLQHFINMVAERNAAFMKPDVLNVNVSIDNTRRRASYNDKTNTMNVYPGIQNFIVVHEMGHWLEDNNPIVKKIIRDFYAQRTRGDVPESIRTLTGVNEYRDDEMTLKDKWPSVYIGKIYSDGATEVLSMGLEMMFKDPIGFADTDAEYFDLIWRILRGRW
jgi:hypothetical protein